MLLKMSCNVLYKHNERWTAARQSPKIISIRDTINYILLYHHGVNYIAETTWHKGDTVSPYCTSQCDTKFRTLLSHCPKVTGDVFNHPVYVIKLLKMSTYFLSSWTLVRTPSNFDWQRMFCFPHLWLDRRLGSTGSTSVFCRGSFNSA